MLFNSSVGELPLVGPAYLRKLKILGVNSIEDLLRHAPSRYLDFRVASMISRVQIGEVVTVRGSISAAFNQYTRSRKKIQIVELNDDTGKIFCIWFNQPFLLRNFKIGTKVSVAGEVGWFGRKKAIISPEYEVGKAGVHTGRLVPIYPQTAGVSSKWLRGRIKVAYDNIEKKDPLPRDVLSKYNLVGIDDAFRLVHFPKNLPDTKRGRKRLAFDELLRLQLTNALRKANWKKQRSTKGLVLSKDELGLFISSLPFVLTPSQKRSMREIVDDIGKTKPMNRLLEGDVGSGKTVVAAVGIFSSKIHGYQSVLMAPTQILAEQHYKTLRSLLAPLKIKIELVTSDLNKSVQGDPDLIIGTHSLIHEKANRKGVDFEKVSYVVIDEQHKFGVEQRAYLVKKSKVPHVLTMTATPIPRTVALATYGDLDLSTLDELPGGRQPITTWVVPPKKRSACYGWIDEQIKKGAQVFVVCPLIEESEAETLKNVRAVTVEYERLKKIFPNRSLGLLHGRLKAKEKTTAINKFSKGKIDILVSTPVVEVGVDIPGATIMLIEAADRFGLAQLHQLRGRVGRRRKKSFCIVMAENRSRKVASRLNALTKSHSGFELAELDLRLRGPGEVFGKLQHGFTQLKVATWQNTLLIRQTKEAAELIVKNPSKYKKLLEKFNEDVIV